MVNVLEHRDAYKENWINFLQKKAEVWNKHTSISIPAKTKKRRLKKPTRDELNLETYVVCEALHGGDSNNIDPTVDGMLVKVT